ncbi:MAG: PKD domain-containing protein [Candidatus Lutacidiplasmatales archaeon]
MKPETNWMALIGAVSVAFLIALSGSSGALASSFSPPTRHAISLSSPSTSSLVASSRVAPATPTVHPQAPRPADAQPPSCTSSNARFLALHGARLPTEVNHALQDPCYVGHDEPSLNFISNGSYSGSRMQFGIQLPPAGTYTASAFATFWVGMWLSGVPCSLNGQSYLEVQINPPDNSIGYTSNPNWTVTAPVWDLVPSGSCDPQCQNDTAFITIDGANYCEDDAALSGVGTYTSTGWGNFAPGDRLSLSMVGQVGGTSGLAIYLNDSTHSSSSLAWTYSKSVSTSGIALEPYFSASNSNATGWGTGVDVAISWENCPEPSFAPSPSSCNSYNAPAVEAVGLPTFLSADYWNASAYAYTDAYPWVATTSSSGGCSGSPQVAPCQDFTNYGGTGSYPYWSVHAAAGKAWWLYGDSSPHQVNALGGALAQFLPNGTPAAYLDPTTVFGLSNSTASSMISVDARAADPSGVQAVELGVFWCFATSTPTAYSVPLLLSNGGTNSSEDGNWTGFISLNTGTYSGTFYYWVSAESSGGVWSTPVYERASVAGGGSSCPLSTPATPGFVSSSIKAASQGYVLNWTETTVGVTNYTITLSPSGGGSPVVVHTGAAKTVRVSTLNSNLTYSISLSATNAAGASSAPSSSVPAPATLFPLLANLTGGSGVPYWPGSAMVNFTATVTGGVGSYTFHFNFGDGTNATTVSGAPTAAVGHNFAGYIGDAMATVTVSDARGDLSPPSNADAIQVWATPLGVPQNASAGDGYVRISWSAPAASPAGPPSRYVVYYTENASAAYLLTSIWPTNSSLYQAYLKFTTSSSLLLPVPDGVTLFAHVLAWNSYGEGFLPATAPNAFAPPILTATPAPLNVGAIATRPGGGGVAPLMENMSAEVSGGTNDTIASAIYDFTSGGSVVPTIEGGNGTYWLNATWTLRAAGTTVIVLHVVDGFNDIGIVTADVYVAPGAVPMLNASLASVGPFWAGTSSLLFDAVASSGSGNYSYAWQFGDGTNSTGPIASHTYSLDGNYTVLATVIDNDTGGTTIQAISVRVDTLPSVSVVASAGPNGSLSYNFSAVLRGGSGPLSVVWAFGDGSTGAGNPVTHDFAASGRYTVNVTVHDPSGPSSSSAVTLEVAGGPAPSSASALGTEGGSLLLLMGVVAFGLLLGGYIAGSNRHRPSPDDEDQ